MTQRVEIHQDFSTPLERVFQEFADHDKLGRILGAPMKLIVEGSGEGGKLGVGSVRRVGPPVVGLEETIVTFKANELIEFENAAKLPAPDLDHHVPTRAEQYSALHLPGPAVDWFARLPGLEASLKARFQPSFSGFGAPAFYDYAASHLDERSKHILHRQGYFYGWGGTGEFEGELRLGPIALQRQAMYGDYRSHVGLDRHVERLSVDLPVRGELLSYSAGLELAPPELPMTVGTGVEVRRWLSSVESFERRGRAVTYGLRIGVEF